MLRNELHTFQDLTESDVEVLDAKQGRFRVTIIEAGPGNKRNGHFYAPQMLEANAQKYVGAPIYKNHEHPREAMKRGGLPRPVEHLAGKIETTIWNPTGGKHKRGAVEGIVRLVDPHMRNLALETPSILGLSHRATASGIKPSLVAGTRHLMVEGIADVESVDLVTKPGAGGGGDWMTESHMEDTVLDNLTMEDLQEHRPDLLEAHAAKLRESDGGNEDFDTRLQEAIAAATPGIESKAADKVRAEFARKDQVRDNRIIVEAMLDEAELPAPSRAIIAKQFEAPFYDLKETDDGEVTPEAQLRQELQEAIKGKKEELAAASGAGSITGMGSGEDGNAPAKTELRTHNAVMKNIFD